MTADLTAKLAAIRAALNRTIDLDAKRTPGEWRADADEVLYGDGCLIADCMVGLYDDIDDRANAAFIATAANTCATTAKALLRALDGLEAAQEDYQTEEQFKATFGALVAICAMWPDMEAKA